MYDIDLQSRTPIYEQLYKKIVELAMKQILKPNEQIPSVRILAKDLGVNPNTVSKAYQQLEHDGIIYSLTGRGSFIAQLDKDMIKEKAFLEFDDNGRMNPSSYYQRIVDVLEELMKFTLLTRDNKDYLVNRYSERIESAEALMKRVNQNQL